MQIQVISDIHLEFNPAFNIVPSADILVLAGDIGNPANDSYRNFIHLVSTLYVQVFIIAGNHEYYGNGENTHWLIKTLCDDYSNVAYLNNASYMYNGIKFIGTTLWSKMDVKFLIYELLDDIPCVVITHHAPILPTKSTIHTPAFATDLTHLFKDNIKLWIHGHTHESGDCIVNNVRVVSNQVGYSDEKTNFDPIKTYTIS